MKNGIILPPLLQGRKVCGADRRGLSMANEFARSLRKNMTPQEVKLWCQLRYLNQEGFHFRRQAPLEGYIVDFLEKKRHIVIEVDGSQHAEDLKFASDQKRDLILTYRGFTVLRFWNIDIDHAMDGVMIKILENLHSPLLFACRELSSPVVGEE
jgi:very-short-patch-repair endonuclease